MQCVEHQDADDRAFDAANAADDDDENHIGGPVCDTERGIRGYARGLHIDQRPGQPGAKGGDQIDEPFHAGRIDTDGFRRLCIVADGGQCEAQAVAQQKVDGGNRQNRQPQGQPIRQNIPRGGFAHTEQVAHKGHARDVTGRFAWKRGAGAAAKRFPLGDQKPGDFGGHPSANGKIRPLQAECEIGGGHGKDKGGHAPHQNSRHRIPTPQDHRAKHGISADADKGLLAHRHHAAIARKQVPKLRQCQHGQDEKQVLDHAAPDKGGQSHGQSDQQDSECACNPAGTGAGDDAV